VLHQIKTYSKAKGSYPSHFIRVPGVSVSSTGDNSSGSNNSGAKLQIPRTGTGSKIHFDTLKENIESLESEISELIQENNLKEQELEKKKEEQEKKKSDAENWVNNIFGFLPFVKSRAELQQEVDNLQKDIDSLIESLNANQESLSKKEEEVKNKRKERDHEYDILARTIWGEARSERKNGRIAVAWVVKNRALKSPINYWSNKISEVCQQPWQFSCWNKKDPNREKLLTTKDKNFEECLDIAKQVLNGTLKDNTDNADHYHTKKPLPSWGDKGVPDWAVGRTGKEIESHIFYNVSG